MKKTLALLSLCVLGYVVNAQTSDTVKVIDMKIQPVTTFNFNKPICFLDGKKFPIDSLTVIDPNTIESIYIVKGLEAKEKYGEAGKNGVLLIERKGSLLRKKED